MKPCREVMRPPIRIPKSIFICLSVLILISVTLGISSCNRNVIKSSEKYNIFILKKGVGQFSFEFSNIYRLNNTDLQNDYTRVFFFSPVLDKAGDTTSIGFRVSKLEAGQTYRSALDEFLRLSTVLPDFKILERFPVTVDGEPGEEVVIYYRQPRATVDFVMPELEGTDTEPVPSIIRRVMFDHNDTTWSIDITSLESISESAGVDLDHIIQTFKILN